MVLKLLRRLVCFLLIVSNEMVLMLFLIFYFFYKKLILALTELVESHINTNKKGSIKPLFILKWLI